MTKINIQGNRTQSRERRSRATHVGSSGFFFCWLSSKVLRCVSLARFVRCALLSA